MSYTDLRKQIKTSKRWLNSVLETLEKNNIIGHNTEKDSYYLIF